MITCRPDLESQIFDSFTKVYFEEIEMYDEMMQNFNDEEIEIKTKNTFKDFIEYIGEIIVSKPGLESSFPRIFARTYFEELEEKIKTDRKNKEDIEITGDKIQTEIAQILINKEGACLIIDYIRARYPDKYDSLAEIEEQIHNSFRQGYSDWCEECERETRGNTSIMMSKAENSRNIEHNNEIENNSELPDNNITDKKVLKEKLPKPLLIYLIYLLPKKEKQKQYNDIY